MHPQPIALNNLLLDPNNYRLQEQDSFSLIAEDRYHLERVQNGTFDRLRRESIRPLRDSIASNGFLEIERIVVVPYEHEDGQFVVIEGNRRVAALRQLRDEYNGGIDIPDSVTAVFDAVPCLVADNANDDSFFKEAIMGIRHVGGIKEWGGYQRAKLISNLYDEHDLDASEISQRLGLSVQEVNRRHRAFKALQQMADDEVYSEYATAGLYPLFHEAVSLPVVREWLQWSMADSAFMNDENKEMFYQLITPRDLEENDVTDPKITTYAQVRQLRDILQNDDAKAELIRLERDFVDAAAVATQGNIARRWRNEVSEAKAALASLPAQDLQDMSSEDLQSIKELVEQAQSIIRMYEKLN